MKTLVILGDSLARPRPKDGVPPNHTYAHRIHEVLAPGIFVANLARNQNDTRLQVTANFLTGTIINYPANYYSLQLGIVDCAPRLVGEFERIILGLGNRYKMGRRVATAYLALKSRYRLALTRMLPRTRVPIKEFRRNIATIIAAIGNIPEFERLFVINIAHPGPYLTERSFGIVRNIESYNAVLRAVADEMGEKALLIDIFNYTKDNPQTLLPDGHHINSEGHAFLAGQIIAALRRPVA